MLNKHRISKKVIAVVLSILVGGYMVPIPTAQAAEEMPIWDNESNDTPSKDALGDQGDDPKDEFPSGAIDQPESSVLTRAETDAEESSEELCFDVPTCYEAYQRALEERDTAEDNYNTARTNEQTAKKNLTTAENQLEVLLQADRTELQQFEQAVQTALNALKRKQQELDGNLQELKATLSTAKQREATERALVLAHQVAVENQYEPQVADLKAQIENLKKQIIRVGSSGGDTTALRDQLNNKREDLTSLQSQYAQALEEAKNADRQQVVDAENALKTAVSNLKTQEARADAAIKTAINEVKAALAAYNAQSKVVKLAYIAKVAAEKALRDAIKNHLPLAEIERLTGIRDEARTTYSDAVDEQNRLLGILNDKKDALQDVRNEWELVLAPLKNAVDHARAQLTIARQARENQLQPYRNAIAARKQAEQALQQAQQENESALQSLKQDVTNAKARLAAEDARLHPAKISVEQQFRPQLNQLKAALNAAYKSLHQAILNGVTGEALTQKQQDVDTAKTAYDTKQTQYNAALTNAKKLDHPAIEEKKQEVEKLIGDLTTATNYRKAKYNEWIAAKNLVRALWNRLQDLLKE
ncbi:MAG: hypothetical protein NC930_02405 [Candidatus Omnitrophica bacterium]|nr:hypothetical protein [Candidatus Omnitrophota bacterium]